MWTILKFEKRNFHQLKKDFSQKLGSEPKYFIPKLKLQKFKKNKLYDSDSLLLGDYLLCFHVNFKNEKVINSLKYCKGLKYFLNGFLNSQQEINEFINKCRIHEDKAGYIKQSFFEFKRNTKYKFMSGPFTNMVFEIIHSQHKKIKILLNNFETTLSNKKYIFRPV